MQNSTVDSERVVMGKGDLRADSQSEFHLRAAIEEQKQITKMTRALRLLA